MAEKKKPCEHEWETIKESVPIDNLEFKKSDAYFITKKCKNCEAKRRIDYKVE